MELHILLLFVYLFIYCNWIVTRWHWLFYMYTKHEIDMTLVLQALMSFISIHLIATLLSVSVLPRTPFWIA